MGGRPGLSSNMVDGLRRTGVVDRGVDGCVKISEGRTPEAKAAASDAGRLATREEMIFLRNL